MIVTKEQIKSIIRLAKVFITNHSDEVDNDDDTVRRVKTIVALLDDGENIEVTDNLDKICNEACGDMSVEVYSTILNAALDKYANDKVFKQIVDEHSNINKPKAITLIGCYIRHVVSNDVYYAILNQ